MLTYCHKERCDMFSCRIVILNHKTIFMRTYITFTFTGGLQTTSRTNTFFSFFHTPVPHPLETPRVGFSTCFPTTAEVTLGRSLQYSSNALTITTDTWDERRNWTDGTTRNPKKRRMKSFPSPGYSTLLTHRYPEGHNWNYRCKRELSSGMSDKNTYEHLVSRPGTVSRDPGNEKK